jgi:hypothetical protein
MPGETADEYDTAGEDGTGRSERGEKHCGGDAEGGLQHCEHDRSDENREGSERPTLGGHRPAVARYRPEPTLIVRFAVVHAIQTHSRGGQVRFPAPAGTGEGTKGLGP